MKAFTIGQAARQAGIGVETVRFYERQGLLEKPVRNKSGYRQYSLQALSRMSFIKKAKEVGFTLKEIKELLSLRLDDTVTCDDIRDRAQKKAREIQEKIDTLQRMKQALQALISACRGKGPAYECPILQGLDEKGGGKWRM